MAVLSIFVLIIAFQALLAISSRLHNIYKSFRSGEWARYSRRLKTAHVVSIFAPFGWLLIFLAFLKSSLFLPLLVIAILYYFLISGPASRELDQQKIKEAIHLTGFRNLMTVSKIVTKAWELSGYRCKHELGWSKQDDDAINASWSRKPGQTVVYCNFFQDNTSSEPSKELSKVFSKEPVYGLHSLDDFIQLSMAIVMTMCYTHERPCLRKKELHERVRDYCTAQVDIESVRGQSTIKQ